MSNNNNTSILAWYSAQSYQQHRKSYAQGQVWPLVCEHYKLPPFQVKRDTLVATPISSLVITHIDTNATYDITGAITTAGLNIQAFTGYDLVVYPAQTAMTDITFPEGQYDAVMTDGTNTWYSERFFMRAYVADLIKIDFWHNTPFAVPDYHISYSDPFRNFVYLNSEVNRPEYVEEEEVEERDGHVFPIFMTSYKLFRIVGVVLPEYMCDVLRLAWMHTNVTVYSDGITYNTDSFRVIFDEWSKPGHLCPITIEFRTDTVVTKTGYVEDENDGGDYDQTDYNNDHLIS